MIIFYKPIYIFLIIFSLGFIFWYFEVYRYRKVLKLDASILNASVDYYMVNFKEYTEKKGFSQIKNYNELVYSFKKISPETYLDNERYIKLKSFIKW